MSAINTWSQTAASNNAAAPNGFPEGMAPSGVNDSAREVMAAVRTFYDDMEWRNFGHSTPSSAYVSSTQFKTAVADGNTTGIYTVGRRIRVVGTNTGTIYGRITASSHSTQTTVTVAWDDANVLDAEEEDPYVVSVGVDNSVGGPMDATSDFVDIDGGEIDGTPIGASVPSTGNFTNLSASGVVTLAGTINASAASWSNAGSAASFNIGGGTILNTVIGNLIGGGTTGNFTDLNSIGLFGASSITMSGTFIHNGNNGDFQVAGTSTFSGNASFATNVTFSGAVSLGNANVTGFNLSGYTATDMTWDGTTTVTGNVDFSGASSVTGLVGLVGWTSTLATADGTLTYTYAGGTGTKTAGLGVNRGQIQLGDDLRTATLHSQGPAGYLEVYSSSGVYSGGRMGNGALIVASGNNPTGGFTTCPKMGVFSYDTGTFSTGEAFCAFDFGSNKVGQGAGGSGRTGVRLVMEQGDGAVTTTAFMPQLSIYTRVEDPAAGANNELYQRAMQIGTRAEGGLVEPGPSVSIGGAPLGPYKSLTVNGEYRTIAAGGTAVSGLSTSVAAASTLSITVVNGLITELA
jgi:hypothetical protein